jgi:hypothetical protein
MKRILFFTIGLIFYNLNYSQPNQEIDVAAYIWPSCHHDERFGDFLWPEGNGEWEVIQKGTPRFEGHYQPKLPLWGYEHDDDPKVFEKWINAATDHGVNVFIFDWYWFDSGPFLESSLNNGFLKAPNKDKMKFYIMWANHDVKKNYWNVHKFTEDETILWKGAVDYANFRIIVSRVIENYFKEPNYYKIDGKPVFSVFHVYNLIDGLGGIEQTKAALNYFREETKKAGFPDLHLQFIALGDQSEGNIKIIEFLEFNSVTKYNWGWNKKQDYLEWANGDIIHRDIWKQSLKIPYFPNVSIGWDDTPRFPHKDKKDIVLYNQSPKTFANYLYKAKEFCESHPEQHKLITIFSWNEWVEGGYLLPDMKYGFEYLESVKSAIHTKYDPYE